MNQIFDWLREQIGNIDVNDIDVLQDMALEKVDEAEAKWESDCCEWKHKEYHTNCFCGHNEGYAEHDFVIGWKFCPYCGKSIKISEVE